MSMSDRLVSQGVDIYLSKVFSEISGGQISRAGLSDISFGLSGEDSEITSGVFVGIHGIYAKMCIYVYKKDNDPSGFEALYFDVPAELLVNEAGMSISSFRDYINGDFFRDRKNYKFGCDFGYMRNVLVPVRAPVDANEAIKSLIRQVIKEDKNNA